MSLSDPLGDMLTRIRNAYGRKKNTVSTPASRLRARVLDVLKAEGYIRDYSQTDFDNGKSEIEIELSISTAHRWCARFPASPSPAAAFMFRPSRSRRLPTVLELPSFRRPRA